VIRLARYSGTAPEFSRGGTTPSPCPLPRHGGEGEIGAAIGRETGSDIAADTAMRLVRYFGRATKRKAWIRGTSPRMTI
jgi:hypothetical protein